MFSCLKLETMVNVSYLIGGYGDTSLNESKNINPTAKQQGIEVRKNLTAREAFSLKNKEKAMGKNIKT